MKTICPRCNFKFKENTLTCPSCNHNTLFIPCYACGNYVAMTADKCMKCGSPVAKKSTGSILLDIIGVLIIFFAIITSNAGGEYYAYSFLAMLILLIVSWRRYKRFCDMPMYDITQAKNTLIAVVVMFVLLFCGFGVVII